MSKCRYDLSEDCNNKYCLNCVLDKIRAEIQTKIKEENYGCISDHTHEDGLEEALEIIDKYTKGEQE